MNPFPRSRFSGAQLRVPAFTLCSAVISLTLVGLAWTETLSAQAVDFDTAGDLTNNFIINGSTGNFAQVASGGISGGAVDVLANNASDTAIYHTAVASGAGQTVSTSVFFRYSRTLRDYRNSRLPIRVGFATSTTVPTSPDSAYPGLEAGAHIQETNDGSGKMSLVCSVGSDMQPVTNPFADLLDGHWYRFTLDLTVSGDASGSLQFKTYLQDFGEDGQTPAARRIVGVATLNSANVTQAAQLYAGFYAQKDGGTDLLDNFSVMVGSTPPKGADLKLTITAVRDPVALGREVIYIATVTNNGPEDSFDVIFEAYLPPGLYGEFAMCDQGCYAEFFGYLDLHIGDIAAGASTHIYLTVHVYSDGPLTTQALVGSNLVQDETLENNITWITTNTIPAPPVPAFSAAVSSSNIKLGQSVTVTANLSGVNPTGEIYLRGFRPDDNFCNNLNPEFTSTVTVNGNGKYTSDIFTPSTVGTYRFITSYYGDDYNADVYGECGASGETVTVTAPTPTPTATPSPIPSPSPTATPSQFGNISTRLNIGVGDNVLIGGFIINGPSGVPKKVMLRGIAPSLNVNGVPVPGRLSDPLLELHKPDGTIVTNDNWVEAANAFDIPADFRPTDNRESVIVASLLPGAYTVLLKGAHGETGVGLVEAYDLEGASAAKLANISTRGLVQSGDSVMIGGFIVTGAPDSAKRVMLRGIGPSLNVNGVPVSGRISDPLLELHKPDGSIETNDNWRDAANVAQIPDGFQPTDDRESVIVTTLAPGAYTVIMRGAHGETGVGLVEAYQMDN